MKQVLIAGASGAIGSALASRVLEHHPEAHVIGLCRTPKAFESGDRCKSLYWDAETDSHADIAEKMADVVGDSGLDTVIYAAGLLHDHSLFPEKRLEDLNAEAMARAFMVNCIGFGTLMKGLMPHLRHRRFKRIIALSAKVGSIEDNGFGGWYAYRCSKAALNMLVRNLSVELPRRCKPVSCIALHPGTTLSPLSEPFQQTLSRLRVHSPDDTADNLWRVIDALTEEDNGYFYSWDGSRLPW
ncbi:short-chain dehydrogenase/reductase SDR [Marinobacter santoriniensis NKSG1]|uniref:Short-chain dehydrogenase/reductase SDR n=1 Tax=Marinobacter santoriniensis NKSG1 TaxID=1288826 RepID=M7CKG0_9GAMM|nr:SDR family oxidoreductase [Marinobacter santoriniensis]EMP54146.1 short-chain dehydrogenase/reductase SDR [Marinobacter santoriniensis NKSG1]